MQTSILIPMGDEPSSMAALRRARGIAQHEHSRLYLLHVVEPKETGDILGAATGASTYALEEEDYARGEAFLEACWHRLNEPMAAVNFVIKGGKLSETIPEEARHLEVETIILGTSKTAPKWEGFLDKIKKSVTCKLIVVDEADNTVLEHYPSE